MGRTPRLLLFFLLSLTISLIHPLFEVTPSAAQRADAPINAIAWSPDSTRYATGDYHGDAKIWDVETGQLLQSFPAPDFNLSAPPLITSISWNPDGIRLAISASASTQPSAYLWVLDLLTGQTIEFDAESLTYTAAWNPDGTMLVAGVTRGNVSYGEHWIKVWDVASQQVVANLEGYSDVIFSVAWSPDGTRLASCSADAIAIIWDTLTWTPLLTLGEFPAHPVLWGSWSPDGTRLATTSIQGTALIWDAVTGQNTMTLYSDDYESLYEIVWNPDGSQLAGVSKYAIKLWDAETGVQIGKLETTTRMSTLAWSPDGTQILVGGIGLRQALIVDPVPLITSSWVPIAPADLSTYTFAAVVSPTPTPAWTEAEQRLIQQVDDALTFHPCDDGWKAYCQE